MAAPHEELRRNHVKALESISQLTKENVRALQRVEALTKENEGLKKQSDGRLVPAGLQSLLELAQGRRWYLVTRQQVSTHSILRVVVAVFGAALVRIEAAPRSSGGGGIGGHHASGEVGLEGVERVRRAAEEASVIGSAVQPSHRLVRSWTEQGREVVLG